MNDLISEKQYNIISYFLTFTAGLKGNGECVHNLNNLPRIVASDIVKNIIAENYNDALYQLDYYKCLSQEDRQKYNLK